jgi:dienelactone hydrolase
MGASRAVNHAPKHLYQRWLADHPPALSFERRGSWTTLEWQARLRRKLADCLGEMPDLVPPEAQELEETDQDDHVRQKWILRTETDFWLPFYLLLPKDHNGRVPAVVALPGHGPGKSRPVGIADTPLEIEKVVEGERDYGLQAVRRGYLALCPDMRGFGESVDKDHEHINYNESCICSAGRSIMLGRTLLGERIWDVRRLIDFLSTRPDVDADRIVCMGQSSGGTVTLFASALEPRIAASVVSGSLCTWARSLYGVYHCPCNFVPNLARFADCGDIAGLAAPRPQLFVAAEHDHFFPIEGVYPAFETVRRIYDSLGAGERVELDVGPEGHRFYKKRVWPFLARWL